ncbi:hypothetical protein R1sor_023103 [Riccia sorocarpa]|uniref:Uncharacterized protein n=1 Tax=Riccia sorocarpa TaxID=122646 RepID=A0ABD3GLR3_9MARC
MTFTRKTGPKRPVENEATVEVEVTRPKRHVKKPIAPADLPETSQRRGKKRVHEVSPGSPPKRRKPAVQPPPKPAPSKARPKVKAPKRLKRERAESVDAVVVEAVEKERSSEGPWLIKRYYKVDVVSQVQWAYTKPEDILGAFAGISEFHKRRLGLRGVITRQKCLHTFLFQLRIEDLAGESLCAPSQIQLLLLFISRRIETKQVLAQGLRADNISR